MNIAELRKRAMRDPQSTTKKEWNAIFSEIRCEEEAVRSYRTKLRRMEK